MGEIMENMFSYDDLLSFGRIKELCRCKGHCCEDVNLEIGPVELKERDEELAKLYIYKYSKPYWHNNSKYTQPNVRVYYYKCREFNKEKRICNIYDDRPRICRVHPVDKKQCLYLGCTLKFIMNKVKPSKAVTYLKKKMD